MIKGNTLLGFRQSITQARRIFMNMFSRRKQQRSITDLMADTRHASVEE